MYDILKGISWKPPPLSEKMKIWISKQVVATDCMYIFTGRTSKTEGIATHIHDDSDDIFPLFGRAKPLVEGCGNLKLRLNIRAKIPRGMQHKVHEVVF